MEYYCTIKNILKFTSMLIELENSIFSAGVQVPKTHAACSYLGTSFKSFLKKYACIWPIIYLAVSKLIIKEPLGVEGSDFGEKTEYR